MSATEVQALLERLVAQFASPYDFLRELVQNSMDAGSDRVEVILDGDETGIIAVLSELDCTFSWDMTGSKADYGPAGRA